VSRKPNPTSHSARTAIMFRWNRFSVDPSTSVRVASVPPAVRRANGYVQLCASDTVERMGLPPEVIAADRALSRASTPTAHQSGEWPRSAADVLSVRAAAELRGVSPSTVQRDRQRADDYQPADDGTIPVRRLVGRDGKHRPSRRFDTTARDLRILALRRIGWSVREIAGEVGCSVGTVHRVIGRMS
jgi:hypothetical protein